jgi:hypothetical protein
MQATSYLDWYRDGPFAQAPQFHRRLALQPRSRTVPQEERTIDAGAVP